MKYCENALHKRTYVDGAIGQYEILSPKRLLNHFDHNNQTIQVGRIFIQHKFGKSDIYNEVAFVTCYWNRNVRLIFEIHDMCFKKHGTTIAINYISNRINLGIKI
jgi:hypothetical protein